MVFRVGFKYSQGASYQVFLVMPSRVLEGERPIFVENDLIRKRRGSSRYLYTINEIKITDRTISAVMNGIWAKVN